jgi:hypothetical protein
MSLYSLAIRWRPEELRSLAFGSVAAGYTALGGPMDNPVVNYKISNLTDANILVSFDGSTDHDIVAANGFVLYDIASNKGKGDVLALTKGAQVYVKRESAAPTSGNVYLTVFYTATN